MYLQGNVDTIALTLLLIYSCKTKQEEIDNY